jgi:hypothetical protein
MVRRLTLLAFLIITSACGNHLSGVPTSPPAQTVPQGAAPTSYQRARFSADEVKMLNEELPEKARQVLERAVEIEVFQISGDGKSVVVKGAGKSEVLDAFYGGIIHPEPMAGCFKPHHGLRAKSGDDKIEIRICFICKNFGGEWGSGEPLGNRMGRIGRSPEAIFNRLLGLG